VIASSLSYDAGIRWLLSKMKKWSLKSFLEKQGRLTFSCTLIVWYGEIVRRTKREPFHSC
jgi:hypothetical protein